VLPDDADDDRCTVDEGANVVTQQSASAYYQPYQNVTVGTWTPPISRGAYKDGETGLAYAGGGSYYAPATGSFIAPDGVGSSSGLDGDPEEDWIGNCGSYGSFLAKAGRKGWNGLKAMPQWQPGSKDRRQISGMLSAIPILGQLKMGLEALTGHDGVGGTCLSTGSRIFNGAMAMLPVVGKVAGEAGGAVRGADAAEEAAASGGLMAVKGTALVRYYPPNNGFLGQPVEEVLERGTVLWRYGSEEGRFLARAGASPLDISLSPDKWNLIPRSYVVQTPFQVSGGIAAPWAPFGTPGGAWQGLSRLSIADLIKGGYLIAK
jgi:hypothetical protein